MGKKQGKPGEGELQQKTRKTEQTKKHYIPPYQLYRTQNKINNPPNKQEQEREQEQEQEQEPITVRITTQQVRDLLEGARGPNRNSFPPNSQSVT